MDARNMSKSIDTEDTYLKRSCFGEIQHREKSKEPLILLVPKSPSDYEEYEIDFCVCKISKWHMIQN